MSQYIVIPNIKIQNANAQPAWWIVGAPALTSYVGFAHALALSIGAQHHEGVAIIHHDIQFLGEQLTSQYGDMDFLPHQFRSSTLIDKSDYAAGKMPLSSQPTARCHINLSLIVAIPDSVTINPSSVELFLRQARIAGGSITQHGKVKCDVKNHDDALSAINKKGDSIVERQDLMIMQDGDRDIIDTLLRVTRRYHLDSSNKMNDETQADSIPWLMPTCLGYAGISSIKKRMKSRHSLQHLYVEPLVGLVQYKSTRDAGLHFWRYRNEMNNVFLLTTNEGSNLK